MEQRSTWGTPPQSKPSEPAKEKLPYIALQRQNDNMTESQKEGVRVWNAMVNKLREHGLMEDKK